MSNLKLINEYNIWVDNNECRIWIDKKIKDVSAAPNLMYRCYIKRKKSARKYLKQGLPENEADTYK
jgi:hypothetical protein